MSQLTPDPPARERSRTRELDLKLEIGWLLHDVHKELSRAFDGQFRALGLTRAQWRVMIHLLRQDGLTQKELADIDQIEKAPMGRLLDKLEETGWIQRRPDPADGRARRVYRTSRIDPILPELEARALAVFACAFAGLPAPEVSQLARVLAAMKGNLHRFVADAQHLKSGA